MWNINAAEAGENSVRVCVAVCVCVFALFNESHVIVVWSSVVVSAAKTTNKLQLNTL